jgi:uncharacterized coiled-coil protein SlyX
MTLQERLHVAKLIEEHFDQANCRYFGDWSDQKIADAAKVPSVRAVADMRLELYGKIERPKPATPADAGVLQRLADLESAMAHTHEQLREGNLRLTAVEERARRLETQVAEQLGMIQAQAVRLSQIERIWPLGQGQLGIDTRSVKGGVLLPAMTAAELAQVGGVEPVPAEFTSSAPISSEEDRLVPRTLAPELLTE